MSTLGLVAAIAFVPVPRFMLWNLFLAAIPLGLAIVLFRHHTTRGIAWWTLLGAWILMLPNAPYVLTDVVHMVEDVQAASSRVRAYESLVTYGVFFAAGLASYVVSLQLFRGFLLRSVPRRAVAPIICALHGLCVVAMYLGRFQRLNSWDVLLTPERVLTTVVRIPQPSTLAMLVVMFVATGLGAFATAAVGEKATVQLRRFVRHRA